MNKAEAIAEYSKCLISVAYYAQKYCTVFDQTSGGNFEFKVFPKQRDLLKHYAKNRFSIVLKPRQAGVSTTTALYCAHTILFAPEDSPQRILIIANKQETAHEFLSKVVSFIDSAPEWLTPYDKKENKVKYLKKNSGEIILPNGSGAKAKATSKDALRGYTPTILVMDEAAFIENGEELWTAALPALSTGGRAILLSTPNGFDSLYYPIYNSAKIGKSNFKIFEMRWFEDPRFNKDLVWKKGELLVTSRKSQDGKWDISHFDDLIIGGYQPYSTWFNDMCLEYQNDSRKIAQELQGDFLGSGDNVVPDEFITDQEKTNVKLPIRTEGFDGNVWIWEDPIAGHQYIISSDVSRGDSADYSTFSIYDAETNNQVVEYQGKIPPDVLGELLNEWGLKYDALCVVDITGGMGQATIIKLLDLKYPNIYYSSAKDNKVIKQQMWKYTKQNDLVPGFVIGNNRTLIIETLANAIRNGDIRIRSQRLINELRTFIYKNGRADHMKGYHDDLIFGLAMGLYVLQYSFKHLKRYNEQTKAMLNAWDVVGTDRVSVHGANVNNPQDYSWLFS